MINFMCGMMELIETIKATGKKQGDVYCFCHAASGHAETPAQHTEACQKLSATVARIDSAVQKFNEDDARLKEQQEREAVETQT